MEIWQRNGQWVMTDWCGGLTAAASHGRQESTLPRATTSYSHIQLFQEQTLADSNSSFPWAFINTSSWALSSSTYINTSRQSLHWTKIQSPTSQCWRASNQFNLKNFCQGEYLFACPLCSQQYGNGQKGLSSPSWLPSLNTCIKGEPSHWIGLS